MYRTAERRAAQTEAHGVFRRDDGHSLGPPDQNPVLLKEFFFARIRSVSRYSALNNIPFWAAWGLINAARGRQNGSWGNFSGGGGGFGSGSSGGGFGGFGGGSFGGGGAGGSW